MTPDDELIAAEGTDLGTCFTWHTYPDGDFAWLPGPDGTHHAYHHNGETHLIPRNNLDTKDPDT